MKLLTVLSFGFLASASMAVPAMAQDFKVANGQSCPAGQRLATTHEVGNNNKACGQLGQWYIARLAGGASLSGSGYHCEIKPKDDRQLGHALCVPQGFVGKWAWSVNGKTDGAVVTMHDNGTCTATNGASCKWRAVGSKFEITWNHGGFVDTMSLSADGKTISGKNKQGDSILGQRR